MTNLFDYLIWRGDLTFGQAPFNEVDSLILCRLSYFPFDGILPAPGSGNFSSIQDCAREFFRQLSTKILEKPAKLLLPEDLSLIGKLASAKRFQSLLLSDYVNDINFEEQKQFSAVTIHLNEQTRFFAFRGTDNTLVGWKEDFNMAFLSPVPSQQEAVDYLEDRMLEFSGNCYTGGHSKGGNLAVYASAACSESAQKRILGVYNNDGPGFPSFFMFTEGYQRVRGRIHTYVPQSSVIGMLLDHEEDYTVVHSSQTGLLQHDLYTWEVLGDSFVRLDTVTNGSKFINLTLKKWVSEMSSVQREQFIDGLFEILQKTNAKTMSELTSDWFKNAVTMLQSLKDIDTGTKQLIFQMLGLLLKAAKTSLSVVLPGGKENLIDPII